MPLWHPLCVFYSGAFERPLSTHCGHLIYQQNCPYEAAIPSLDQWTFVTRWMRQSEFPNKD